MTDRTQISLRQFLALVVYLSILSYFILSPSGEESFSHPMTWVYDYARLVPTEPILAFPVVGGMLLLIGTIPPFLKFRWWTLLPAVVCGLLYLAIGSAEAIY